MERDIQWLSYVVFAIAPFYMPGKNEIIVIISPAQPILNPNISKTDISRLLLTDIAHTSVEKLSFIKIQFFQCEFS